MTLSDRPFFFFGSLQDPDICREVFGRELTADDIRPAVLADYRAVCVPEDTAPVLLAEPGARTIGIVVNKLSPVELARLEFFESVDYATRHVGVQLTSGESLQAEVWLDSHYTADAARTWHYDDWVIRHKAAFLQMTQQYMTYFAAGDITAAEDCWDRLHRTHMAQLGEQPGE